MRKVKHADELTQIIPPDESDIQAEYDEDYECWLDEVEQDLRWMEWKEDQLLVQRERRAIEEESLNDALHWLKEESLSLDLDGDENECPF